MSSRVGFISKNYNFNCTTKPGDFTASYKSRSQKGDFKALNESVLTYYIQIDIHIMSSQLASGLMTLFSWVKAFSN